MNNTFTSEEFDAAIASKDYIKIKNYIINSIRNNPRFSYKKGEGKSEAAKAFDKLLSLQDKLPGLFTPYTIQEGEVEFNENDKTSWTQEYFIRQTFLLGENFCVRRFNNIRKIGQYLTKGNFSDPQEVMEGYEKNESNLETEMIEVSYHKNLISNVTIVLAIISIVTLLVGMLIKTKWLIIVGIVLLLISLIYNFFSARR